MPENRICPSSVLYCEATRFSLLFEIFDFGNSRGSYFAFLSFGVTYAPCFPFKMRSKTAEPCRAYPCIFVCNKKLLDIDTGGGEFLLSLGNPYDMTSATEAYPPNVRLCKKHLSLLELTSVKQDFCNMGLGDFAPS